MTLDARLEAALQFIGAETHADIGSDHAKLPTELVRRGKVKRAVIVEKTAGPFQTASESVARAGLSELIEVRLGDGFSPLERGEVQSASLTGMGARTILGILGRAEALPPRLVLQPNDAPRLLRVWSLDSGYHLADEALAPGFWPYAVLSLRQGRGEDPAYADLPHDLGLTWGPHLLKRRDGLLIRQLLGHERRLSQVARFGSPEVRRDLAAVEDALRWLKDEKAEPSLT